MSVATGTNPMLAIIMESVAAAAALPRAEDQVMGEAAAGPPPLEDPPDWREEEEGRPDPMAPDGVPICSAGTMGDAVRPHYGVPENWPVYEAYALNVPRGALKATVDPTECTWGSFASDPQSEACKRLLFLLTRAAEMATKSRISDPDKLAPVTADLHGRRRHEARIDEYLAANPAGKVIERASKGVGGASMGTLEDPLIEELSEMLSLTDRRTLNNLRARTTPGSEHGVFVFRDLLGQDGTERSILVRRMSLVVEELMSGRGARVEGWRWWFLVHDPRLLFAKWIRRVTQESKQVFASQAAAVARAERTGRRIGPRLREPPDPIGTVNCYRRINSAKAFSDALRTYYGQGGAMRPPQYDAAAMGSGLAAASSYLHPCRSLCPQVAMRLHVESKVCEAQRDIENYVDRQTERLGRMIRPARSVSYDPGQFGIDRVHGMTVPHNPQRAELVNSMMLRALRSPDSRAPQDLIMAAEGGDITTALSICNQMPDEQRDRLWDRMERAVGEDLLESLELGAYEASSSSDGSGHRSQRRRLEDRFSVGGTDTDIGGDGDEEDEGSSGGAISLLAPLPEASAVAAAASPYQGGALARPGPSDAYDPENSVNVSMLSQLLRSEEVGASLKGEDVSRSPLLFLRTFHHRVLEAKRASHLPGTPGFRTALRGFRERALINFETTLMSHLDDPMRLSGPLRLGAKFLFTITKKPNRILRHKQAVRARVNSRREVQRARIRLGQNLLLTSMARGRLDRMAGGAGGAGGGGIAASGMAHDDPQTMWHEWPIVAMNLTAYGNWRVSMRHRTVKCFRCRPGAGPDLLHRLLLAQGTAWTYLWDLHGDQLMWGKGGSGKSFMLHCIKRQAFPGQVRYVDHLTERSFAVDQDMNDLLIMIEELHPRFVGQDEKGNPVPGDELLKTLMTRHYIETQQPHITDDGQRIRVTASARTMITFFGCTNLVIKKMYDGQLPAILRRWMMDHVGWGKQDVPLAAINNPIGQETDDPRCAAFYHQMSVVNVLCMMVEKLIEAKVLQDINTDVCSFHFSWFFEAVHKQCRVPKASGSILAMLRQLCRQTCLRYAVHRLFFSETASTGTRCKRAGPGPGFGGEEAMEVEDEEEEGAADQNPEKWVPRKFELKMLLEIQPFLVVTEEMIVDVLTTTRSTYMPTTNWGVLKTLRKITDRVRMTHRRITKRRLNSERKETAGSRKKSKRRERQSARAQQQQQQQQQEQEEQEEQPDVPEPMEEEEEADGDVAEFDLVGGGVLAEAMQQQHRRGQGGAGEGGEGEEEDEDDLETVVDDRNYYRFVHPNFESACDYFAHESHGTIQSRVIRQVLEQLKHERIVHRDRNRPKLSTQTGEIMLDPETGEEIYEEEIESLVVLWERDPEGDGASVSSSSRGRRRGGRGWHQASMQICILIEYLEQERNDSINSILQHGLSYHGARERIVVSACGPKDLIPVRDHEGNLTGVHTVEEFMGVIHIKPTPGRYLSRVNHFPENRVTDACVFNESLDPTGTKPRGWGNSRTDMYRRRQLYLDTDLDEVTIRSYWNHVGLPEDEENFPWTHTERLMEMARAGKDGTGTSISSCCMLGQLDYPEDFRRRKVQRARQRRGGAEAEDGESGSESEDDEPEEEYVMSSDDEEMVDADDDGPEEQEEQEQADPEEPSEAQPRRRYPRRRRVRRHDHFRRFMDQSRKRDRAGNLLY